MTVGTRRRWSVALAATACAAGVIAGGAAAGYWDGLLGLLGKRGEPPICGTKLPGWVQSGVDVQTDKAAVVYSCAEKNGERLRVRVTMNREGFAWIALNRKPEARALRRDGGSLPMRWIKQGRETLLPPRTELQLSFERPTKAAFRIQGSAQTNAASMLASAALKGIQETIGQGGGKIPGAVSEAVTACLPTFVNTDTFQLDNPNPSTVFDCVSAALAKSLPGVQPAKITTGLAVLKKATIYAKIGDYATSIADQALDRTWRPTVIDTVAKPIQATGGSSAVLGVHKCGTRLGKPILSYNLGCVEALRLIRAFRAGHQPAGWTLANNDDGTAIIHRPADRETIFFGGARVFVKHVGVLVLEKLRGNPAVWFAEPYQDSQ